MAKIKTKTKSELEAEIKILRGGCRLESITKIFKTFFIVCGFIYAFHIIGEVAKEWSGKDTNANINVLADIKASADINADKSTNNQIVQKVVPAYSWLPGILGLIFGVAGISYGRAESKARRDIIERLHPYQEGWEKEQDPNRTTSKLTKRGDTRPEDL
jgi:hypothetical protein